MFVVSAWLAAYYNWWHARVQTRPRLWQFGIGIVQFPIFFALTALFQDDKEPIGLVLFFLIMGSLVPAFFAAADVDRENRKLEQMKADQDEENRSRLRKIWRLLDRGRD